MKLGPCAVVVLLVAGAHARLALADTREGTLGAAASASDYYQVTCSDDGSGPPASFSVQVSDAPPAAAPIVSVQVRAFRTGPATYAARNSTDTSDGDGVSSPLAFVNFGAGTFDVFVDKTAAGSEDYVLTFLCTTAANGGGVRTGTAITATSVAAPVPALGFAGQLALCALLLAGLARGALAHTQAGSLGDAAGATDYYQVTCLDDGAGAPASLSIQLQDASPAAAPFVSVQARKGTLLASSTDPSDADSAPGPLIHVNGGAGVYDVLVDKTAASAVLYTLTFHCTTGENGTGQHTGTEIVARQNQ
ncbi:MAG: hypothetical protein WEF50_14600 [Myxococcota bacterium]